MLPTEAFADVIAFLRLFDLSALAVINIRCSTLAIKASNKIRWEEFHGLEFFICISRISIYRRNDPPTDEEGHRRLQIVATLTFESEGDVIAFVSAAFPNCSLEDVNISCFVSRRILQAFGQVADSIVINGVLRFLYCMSHDDSLVVRKFRKVKAMEPFGELKDEDVDKTANLYRGSGVQELRYYGSYPYSTLIKLALV